LEVNPLHENRFTTDNRIAHERRLQEAKREFIERRAEIKLLQGEYRDDERLRFTIATNQPPHRP
jgi:hypothetical protein